ncbi:MAG: 1,2-phenylacetyl-CoA epoxidase subunit PaaE [Chitinophagales bacterium]|jgi:ring-1,2-phenylacetyl-CoA epoxidase subunit PaaE
MKFHPLSVREIRQETPDCVSVSLDIPAHLQAEFQFTPGQYLTLRTELNGEEVRRSYSICTAPSEQDCRVAIKKVPDGRFSSFANEVLQPGDLLEVMPPQGKFTHQSDPSLARTFVGIAAGSGITPVLSILKTVLFQEPNSQFLLFYGNRGFDHIIFREELEQLKNQYPNRLSVHHIFSRESMGNDLYQGYINGEKCQIFGRVFFKPQEVDAFFICGPEEMIFECKETLEQLGVDPKKIKFELFATGTSKQPKKEVKKEDVIDAEISVLQDGARFDFRLPSDGSTLLDAAMRAGADLPFSCKGGVCSTCKAKVLEGEVSMDLNYGLEPDEVAAGFVLTCQAHPKSDRVVISFDEG